MNKIFAFLFFCCFSFSSVAQELNAKVTVVATRVGNNVNRNVFMTLQSALTNFLNNRKWSSEPYAANEKIDCNFLLNLDQTSETNVYSASLTVQAARPAYNTSYLSPIINYKDDNIIFKYVEFQILEFNDNRVSGSDALVSNLTAIMAYYAHLVLAFDNASFANHGGDAHFQKALNIVNNAPDGRGISGWKPFDGIRNRYWLVENMTNSRYNIMHDVYYNYYRKGLDKMYEDENAARTELINVLNLLSVFNTENPNTMINQFFFQGKSAELIKIFSKAKPQEKIQAKEILSKIDLTNATAYKEQLK
ncbi:MAG: DUF4835 family protein [Sphingobacteriales bacterium]|nr:MAG: DUF4835 family protein [Sphingobacteriales bacterium]